MSTQGGTIGPAMVIEDMPHYSAEIDMISQREWTEALHGFDDATIFQSWEYGQGFIGTRQATRMVLKKEGRIVAMAQGRIIKPPFLPVGTAHFLYAPLWRKSGRPDLEVLARMLSAMRQAYAIRKGLLLCVRSHEQDGFERESEVAAIFARHGFERQAEAFYRTITLDLTPDLQELRAGLRPKWRRNLSRAERKGMTLVMGAGDEHFAIYKELHHEMFRRKNPQQWYNPDLDRFWDVIVALPEDHHRMILVAEYDDTPVASIVLAGLGSTGMDLFSATADRALNEKLNALYYLQWQAIIWLKQQGYSRYDLRGYDPERFPGVSYFKAGLAGEEIRFAEFQACEREMSRLLLSGGHKIVDALRLRNVVLGKERLAARISRGL